MTQSIWQAGVDVETAVVRFSDACCCHPFGWLLDWSRGDLWLGSTSFSAHGNFLGEGPGDQGQVSGNFGFQEGFNFGTRLPGVMGGQLGSQLGMRFTQTQLEGTNAGHDSRQQTFITAGLFRRVDYGLQGGLVVDYLHDDWLYKADLLQFQTPAFCFRLVMISDFASPTASRPTTRRPFCAVEPFPSTSVFPL